MAECDIETTVESIDAGHQRKFVQEPSGYCRVYIRHRQTSKDVSPVMWSSWELWGDYENAKMARDEHDAAIMYGPWGKK